MATAEQLRALERDWDSYGAEAIDERCIQEALRIQARLDHVFDMVPVCTGGVALEWRGNGLEVEISVDPLPEGNAREITGDADGS